MSNLRIVQSGRSVEAAIASKDNLLGDVLGKKLAVSQSSELSQSTHIAGIGAAWDIGTSLFGSSLGPAVYGRMSRLAAVIQNRVSSPKLVAYAAHPARQAFIISRLGGLCLELAHHVSKAVKQRKKLAIIGGDHSCAIGTWHGVADALGKQNPFGLIWIDAHLDAHTPETSVSGNLHGMPLATLLGYGNEKLLNLLVTSPVLEAEDVVIIGARNVETEELELLQDLGVRIYFMPEIKKRGLNSILIEARERVTSRSKYFGVSIDLDAIDPLQAPGVNTPVSDGLNANELIKALQLLCQQTHQCEGFLGIEIAEFNPLNDKAYRTVQLIDNLLESLLPGLSTAS